MPRYDYRCVSCGVFEAEGSREERETECACGNTATRLPFSGAPYLRGQTVPRQIPDPVYREEAEHRELTKTWGTAERSVEMIRKNIVVDKNGNKSVNVAGMI